ncbi:small GTP-binding protein [Tritrichomonas foetus]|uniref:Small GTP-binding protein n=1 Tax=Tritrichomonas foetus TaxID=1144522 RepID=A0A1J4K0R2_9EUKA|nr:small GTP-binding protein [Tritrichomonas foetus]|eukprot:OHT03332.1 small GTP-binding protein [Tritrichomonas foetus]
MFSSSAYGTNPYANIRESKIVMLGDTQVGKTTLLYALQKNEFNEGIEPTIGSNVVQIDHQFDNGQYITLNFYDTAGQERYNSITTFYIQGASGALICFDPTIENWHDSVNKWKNIVLDSDPKIFIFAVATKSDLWIHNNDLAMSLFSDVHKKCNIETVFHVSSLTMDSLGDLKSSLAEKCMEEKHTPTPSVLVLDNSDLQQQNQKSACGCF